MAKKDGREPGRVRTARRRLRRARRVRAVASIAILGGLAARELRRPPEQRTWHGRVLGVPYSLRPAPPRELRRRLWQPDGPLFVPKVFGLGWDVNLGRAVELVRRRRGQP